VLLTIANRQAEFEHAAGVREWFLLFPFEGPASEEEGYFFLVFSFFLFFKEASFILFSFLVFIVELVADLFSFSFFFF